jgi:hypothetical protein
MAMVVNRHKEEFDVYIGRGTPWGNPFKGLPRGESIRKHREWLENPERILMQLDGCTYDNHWVINNIDKLRGKRIGCSCKPKSCHGDILMELANNTDEIFEI